MASEILPEILKEIPVKYESGILKHIIKGAM